MHIYMYSSMYVHTHVYLYIVLFLHLPSQPVPADPPIWLSLIFDLYPANETSFAGRMVRFQKKHDLQGGASFWKNQPRGGGEEEGWELRDVRFERAAYVISNF